MGTHVDARFFLLKRLVSNEILAPNPLPQNRLWLSRQHRGPSRKKGGFPQPLRTKRFEALRAFETKAASKLSKASKPRTKPLRLRLRSRSRFKAFEGEDEAPSMPRFPSSSALKPLKELSCLYWGGHLSSPTFLINFSAPHLGPQMEWISIQHSVRKPSHVLGLLWPVA